MDELQQRGMLTPNRDRAVWTARFTLGEWQQDLTLLRFPVSRLWPDPATRRDTCQRTILPLVYMTAPKPPMPRAAPQSVMDEPPPREMSASTSPNPRTARTRGRIPGACGGRCRADFTRRDDHRGAGVHETPGPGTGLSRLAQTRAPNAELPINTVNARVHRVREGVLLVSPGIFRDYAMRRRPPGPTPEALPEAPAPPQDARGPQYLDLYGRRRTPYPRAQGHLAGGPRKGAGTRPHAASAERPRGPGAKEERVKGKGKGTGFARRGRGGIVSSNGKGP